MLIQGSVKSNRTNLLAEYYVRLLDSGVEASEILVLLLNSYKKNLFTQVVKNNLKTAHYENPQIYTFGGLVYNTLINNWSVLEKSILSPAPVALPHLIGLEISQFFIKHAVKEVGFKDYNSKINLIHQIFRRYSLIVNNCLSDKDVEMRSGFLNETFAQDAERAIDIYKKKTIDYRAFDNIRQLSIFRYLYNNTNSFKDIKYLIVDDADEITTAEHEFLKFLKPSLQGSYIGYDRYGSSRLGYLNTDIKTVERLEKLFEDDKKINLDNLPDVYLNKEYFSFSRRLEMIENVLDKVQELIDSGVDPSDIAIVTPVIDNSLKFSLGEKFISQNIGLQYFSGSEKLCDIPIIRDTLTLLNIALGEYQDVFKIRSLISSLLKIPVKYCMNLVSKYKESGQLKSVDFGVSEYNETFEHFLDILQKIKDEKLCLSDKIFHIYKNILNIDKEELWQLEFFNFFIKQITDFEAVFEEQKYNTVFQKNVLVQIQNSIISENPSFAPELKDNHIVVATAQKIIDFSIKTKYQFWLDVSSNSWIKDDYGTLYNAWAFQNSWNKDSFTYEDNLELSKLRCTKQLRKLSLLCNHVYAFSSLFDIEGNENLGGIESFIITNEQTNNNRIKFEFTPRDDQKPVLEYKQGKMSVSAVPGAGKTTILLALIIKLIQSGVKSDNIFVMTYMESAARNIKERIKKACPDIEKLPNISTIHGLALRILKENSNYIKVGLDSDFEVCDDNTRQKIIRELISKSGSEQDDYDKYEKAVSLLKLSVLKKIPYIKDFELVKFIKFYSAYNFYLKQRNMIDYDDMLSLSVKILEENPDIAAFYQDICKFIIEDEAQDSSVIQQKLLNILSAKHKNLIRCGDINQAITTTFTNADIDGFKKFTNEAVNVSMNCSQRCAKDIYTLANNLIDYATDQPALKNAFWNIKMRGVEGKNPIVKNAVNVNKFDSYVDERNFLIEKIREIYEKDKNATVAILVRNNHHLDEYSEFLSCYGYNVITQNDCLNSQPVFNLIFAVTQFCVFPWRNENILLIMNVLKKQGLRNFTVSDYEFVKGLDFPFILQKEEFIESENLGQLLWDLNYWLQNACLSVEELALKVGHYYYNTEIDKSNVYIISLILKRLSQQYPDNIVLLEKLKDISSRPVLNKFKFFVEDSQNTQNRGSVQVMTYHKSKGDEFDYVFIPQLCEDFLPLDLNNIKIKSKERFLESVKAINSKYNKKDETALKLFQAEENIRLFYVAITRARKKLYISFAQKYKKFSKVKEAKPSILFEKFLELNQIYDAGCSIAGVSNDTSDR